jgi:hypothetical protein
MPLYPGSYGVPKKNTLDGGENMFKKSIVVVMMLALVSAAGATTINSPATGERNSAGITVTGGAWSANIATYADFTSQVNSIMGYDYVPEGGLGGGYADVEWSDTDYNVNGWAAPYVMTGAHATGNRIGSVVYKFVVPLGLITDAGGTVSAAVEFRGNRLNTGSWMGISATAPTHNARFDEIENKAAFTKAYMDPVNSDWGTYRQTLTLDIPAGATEFYVAFVRDWGSQNRIGFSALNVNSVLTPEPVSMMLLGLGGLAVLRRK